jgi:hypothetical protein
LGRRLVEDRSVLNGLFGWFGSFRRGRGLLDRLLGGVALGLALSGFGCSEELSQRAVTHACAFSRH